MTYTTGLRALRPILAIDKSKAKTTSAAVTEGDKAFTFTNTSSAIVVDDLVFLSSSADASIQFLGKCTVSDDAGITTQFGAQSSTGASSKIWTPTSYAYFEYGAAGGTANLIDPGSTVTVTRGAVAYAQQTADTLERVRVAVGVARPSTWQSFRTLVITTLSVGTTPCSLAFWDAPTGAARCVEGLVDLGAFSFTADADDVTSFGFEMIVQTEDTYATS